MSSSLDGGVLLASWTGLWNLSMSLKILPTKPSLQVINDSRQFLDVRDVTWSLLCKIDWDNNESYMSKNCKVSFIANIYSLHLVYLEGVPWQRGFHCNGIPQSRSS